MMTNQLNINVLGIASNLRRIVNVNNHSDGISNWLKVASVVVLHGPVHQVLELVRPLPVRGVLLRPLPVDPGDEAGDGDPEDQGDHDHCAHHVVLEELEEAAHAYLVINIFNARTSQFRITRLSSARS